MKKIAIFVCMICLMAIWGTNKAFAQLGKGYYYVHVALDTNYCLDLQKAIVQDGRNIQLYRSNGTKAQHWYFQPNSDGTYFIRSAMNTDYVLDVQKGIVQDGTNIQLYHYNGTKAQRWYLKPAGKDYFYIQSASPTAITFNSTIIMAPKPKGGRLTSDGHLRHKR